MSYTEKYKLSINRTHSEFDSKTDSIAIYHLKSADKLIARLETENSELKITVRLRDEDITMQASEIGKANQTIEHNQKISENLAKGYEIQQKRIAELEAIVTNRNNRISEFWGALFVASSSESFSTEEQLAVIDQWVCEGSKLATRPNPERK